MLNKRIEFEEKHVNEVSGTTILYFMAPKEMLNGRYPEADAAAISVEFPTGDPNPQHTTVWVSPMKDKEDYDYCSVNFSDDEIEELIRLAEREGGELQ
ncbi:hypothetical protein [Anaerotruncus colihominis]|uniref:Uncharacterized protein n=1 Tax=Anaerotruncus colihominis TaxID=169435 RepID=A0A845STK5_9FIRM|nr:hypothetical protein [Anaerotruncus colihominis]NDO37760.1 hypothetical protein [Anaerotruncus colihominis]